MQDGWRRQVLSFMQTRQILRFPAKVSVSLKRHTFLRKNSRNQPFIYLQSNDILGLDCEKNINWYTEYPARKLMWKSLFGWNTYRDVINVKTTSMIFSKLWDSLILI